MDNINLRDLAHYRIEMAESKIKAAEVLIIQGMYADAVSRIYYGIFHAARAILALKGLEFPKNIQELYLSLISIMLSQAYCLKIMEK